MNALFMLQTTAQCDHPSQVSARSSRHTASTSSPSAQQLAKHSVLAEGGRLPDVDCTLILCGQSLHLAAIIPPAAESPALTGDAPLLRGSSCERAGLPCTRIFENSKKILRRAPFKKYFSKWQAPQKKNLVFPEKIWDLTPVLGLSSPLI